MSAQTELPASLRAYLENSNVALAVSETDGDMPLTMVNAAFCELTGYDPEDVVGRNCRLLQGPETSDDSRRALHDFVHDPAQDAGRFPVLNYRKDGSSFHNYVFMTRLRDSRGAAHFILASQFDMTTALQRSQIRVNDAELHHALSDVEQIGREFGLAMVGSAQIISDSVATLARLTLDEDRR
ncbi:PAS domain-containing protein [Roseivivax sp.]